MIARIRLEQNLEGRLRQFFFRLPEVRAVFFGEAGNSFSARIPPDVMTNGVPLNFTPSDVAGARALFTSNQRNESDVLSLAGAGLDAYKPVASVELLEIPEIELAPASRNDSAAGALEAGSIDTAKIEMLNNDSVQPYGPNEIIEVSDAPGYVFLQGWAFDGSTGQPAGGVSVELDGKPYRAQYGLPNEGIAVALRHPEYRMSGFQWIVPVWKLGHAPHELRLRVLSLDGKRWHPTAQKLRFRIVP